MRASQIISVLLISWASFYPAQTLADISIRFDRLFPNQPPQPVYSTSIKNNLIRFNQLSGQQSSVMLNLDNGDIIQMHEPSQRYFRTDAQTLNRYAHFYQSNRTLLQGLIDQGMRQMDPQSRDKVEQIVDGFKKGPADTLIEFEALPTRDEVLGVPCQVLAIYENRQRVRDICFASYQQLGLGPDDIHSLERLKHSINLIKPSAPVKFRALLDTVASGVKQLNGVPMKVVQYRPDGSVLQVVQAARISVRALSEQTFLVPPHFEQQTFPLL